MQSEFIGAIAYDRTKDILVDKKTVKLTLYDTGSSGDYDQLRISTYPDTSILLLCFSIKNKESFQNIEERWIPEILHYFSESPVPFLLIGCQKDARYGWDLKDMTPKDLVTVEEAERMAKRIGAAMYLECSAYTGEGVNEVFEHAARITMPKLKWKKNGTCLVI